ncbi:glutathione S-transferase N-terminal domain-containing protein [Pseudoroseomonas globiformis]|uniref:Glutathione S-transferase N-terminal domain-containing protein n=1 Tax=Teichococcus globiformis TaxID=2307229 RepID=A0ABV7FUI7_9PROT
MMKLFHSPTSPYVRKVMACVLLRGLQGKVELVPTSPMQNPGDLQAANPLGKIPCLVTEDGTAIYDSPVICEYLDGLGNAAPLFPAPGPARIASLTLQALADGIADAAVARQQGRAQQEEAGPTPRQAAFQERQLAAIRRGLAALEASPPAALAEIGAVAAACALGYLDLRLPELGWRATHPKLAAWLASVEASPALSRTLPPTA